MEERKKTYETFDVTFTFMIYYYHPFTFNVTFQRYQDLPSAIALRIPVDLPPSLAGLKWGNLILLSKRFLFGTSIPKFLRA